MLTKLTLKNFKSFRNAELHMGPLTLLVGANASGKSNLRDAFRFLHGIARGYSIADIIGEKWVEGGVLQWRGIRGGTREAAFIGERVFEVITDLKSEGLKYQHRINVDVGENGQAPRVVRESLYQNNDTPHDWRGMIFDSHPEDDPPAQDADQSHIHVRLPRDYSNRKHGKRVQMLSMQPVISQIVTKTIPRAVAYQCEIALDLLSSIRFLDLSVEAMRQPSLPGQIVLGDRGENLSSVLQATCANAKLQTALARWIQALTPMDAQTLEFPADQTGKILVSLVEKDGRKVSAHSASDGTLRFLAMIAALLGPEPSHFYFFEELENGIHPTRLHLIIDLLEQQVADGRIQIVATTHSPQLLLALSEKSRKHASLVYRLEKTSDSKITRILDIPTASEVIQNHDLAQLMSTGWLEDTVEFASSEDDQP